jgi:Lon protease-like protein
VLITEGTEAGTSPTETSDVGTYAKIVDFSGQPDGLLGIEARGERRFRIHARRRARDGLNVAEVEWLPDDPRVPLPDEFAELGPALDFVLRQVGDPYESLERHLDDASWVAGRLAEILPLPTVHKQHCLELDDPIERLRFLRPLFEITTEPPDDEDEDEDEDEGEEGEDDEDEDEDEDEEDQDEDEDEDEDEDH